VPRWGTSSGCVSFSVGEDQRLAERLAWRQREGRNNAAVDCWNQFRRGPRMLGAALSTRLIVELLNYRLIVELSGLSVRQP
jgi:hypothetical protein